MADDKWTSRDRWIRDFFIWIVGVSAMINELFLKPEPDSSILVFLAGMLGIPLVLKMDEARRNGKK